mgnify:CR=1 FL=1
MGEGLLGGKWLEGYGDDTPGMIYLPGKDDATTPNALSAILERLRGASGGSLASVGFIVTES